MRGRSVLACIAILLAVGCGSPRRLSMVVAPDPLTPEIGRGLVAILADAGIELELVEGEGSVANLERIGRGEVDLGIVENNARYRRDVRTLLPLYLGVLHVLHRVDQAPAHGVDLFRGRSVFAGEVGGMGRWFLHLITEKLAIPEESYRLVHGRDDDPDVVFLFRPVPPPAAVIQEILGRYAFYSIGDPDRLGRGSVVEGLALSYPQLEPFVIPARTYGPVNPEPVLTAAVATLLVAREGLPAPIAYDLVEAVVDHKQELAALHPALFSGISDRFEADDLNFPLHPGARSYLQRDEPGFFERYAELAGVSFSVSLALVSGLVAVARWRERVRKNRIDAYYAKVLRLRAVCLEHPSLGGLSEAISQIEELEAEAFRELIAERLSADESFRIFVALASDSREELRRRLQHMEGA